MNQIDKNIPEAIKTALGVTSAEPPVATCARALVDVNGLVLRQAGNKTACVPVIISGDGAITLQDSTVFLTKGSEAAITMAAPSNQDGTEITVIADSNYAHVITFPSAICFDGTTGGNTTATFAAFKGASITFVAAGATWLTKSINLVTCAP